MARCRSLIGGTVLALLAATPAAAGEWQLGTRMVSIRPRDSSSVILASGSQLGIDSVLSLELHCAYRMSWNWALELSLTGAGLDMTGREGSYEGKALGETKIALPTVAAIYRLDPVGRLGPYMGLGLSYATFSGSRLSARIRAQGLETLKVSNGIGIAYQAGVDLDIHDNWKVNLDVKYVRLGTDVTVSDSEGAAVMVIRADVNPWLFGLGAVYRF